MEEVEDRWSGSTGIGLSFRWLLFMFSVKTEFHKFF